MEGVSSQPFRHLTAACSSEGLSLVAAACVGSRRGRERGRHTGNEKQTNIFGSISQFRSNHLFRFVVCRVGRPFSVRPPSCGMKDDLAACTYSSICGSCRRSRSFFAGSLVRAGAPLPELVARSSHHVGARFAMKDMPTCPRSGRYHNESLQPCDDLLLVVGGTVQ